MIISTILLRKKWLGIPHSSGNVSLVVIDILYCDCDHGNDYGEDEDAYDNDESHDETNNDFNSHDDINNDDNGKSIHYNIMVIAIGDYHNDDVNENKYNGKDDGKEEEQVEEEEEEKQEEQEEEEEE